MVINKYLAGLLTLAIVALTGWQVILPDGITPTEGWQFGALVVASGGTVFVPLLEGGWAGGLKVGVAVAAAVFAAGVPSVTQGVFFWQDGQAFLVVGIAARNALAVQIGVAVRVDTAKAVIADPVIPNRTIESVDPAAVYAAHRGERELWLTMR